jgi:protein-S-isoprenylcysteine O-methyltransferase Ste14
MMEAIHRLFNDPTVRRALLKLRLVLGLAAVVGLAMLIKRGPREWFWPGMAVSALGAIAQWWCFACIMTAKELAANGPYAYVRNPMYLARFLLVFGLVMMTGNPWLMGVMAVLYYLYMVNRVRREEPKLATLFGAPYEAYCRAVPRFVPSPRRYPEGQSLFWSWTCFRRNHGPTNAVTVVVAYAALWWFVFVQGA